MRVHFCPTACLGRRTVNGDARHDPRLAQHSARPGLVSELGTERGGIGHGV